MAEIQQPTTVRMAVADLKPSPYNPRRIDDASLHALGESIERFGLVEPIIWNKRSGRVVGGHQRLRVLREANVSDVDVVQVDLDDNDEKALNIALNSPLLEGK